MENGKSVERSQLDQIDPTKVRILLCDIDAQSCQETLELLCKCSYQAQEVLDALKYKGPLAHIILVEAELLMANDARMMRYIMHDKRLQRIPVIILTRQDQVSITMNELRLGAADFLMKPLQNDVVSSLGMWLRN